MALPAVMGNLGITMVHADYIRDLLGNLEMMMRILINSAGALCAYTSLGGDPKAMARLLCSSRSRAEWSRPPTAIVSLV